VDQPLLVDVDLFEKRLYLLLDLVGLELEVDFGHLRFGNGSMGGGLGRSFGH
jgi:hypothetical protein